MKNKATRTENSFKERTNTSSRETETEENDREKTNQTATKDQKICYAYGVKVNSTFSLHIKET